MRGAVQHRAHAERELLDFVEHGVDLARQRVDLVVRIAHRQALRQIAAHDLRRNRRDRAGLRQDAPAHPKAAPQTEQQGQHDGRDQAAHHQVLDVLPLLHVMAHQHAVAARQRKALRAHFMVAGLVAERHRDLELDPLAFVAHRSSAKPAHCRPPDAAADRPSDTPRRARPDPAIAARSVR